MAILTSLRSKRSKQEEMKMSKIDDVDVIREIEKVGVPPQLENFYKEYKARFKSEESKCMKCQQKIIDSNIYKKESVEIYLRCIIDLIERKKSIMCNADEPHKEYAQVRLLEFLEGISIMIRTTRKILESHTDSVGDDIMKLYLDKYSYDLLKKIERRCLLLRS